MVRQYGSPKEDPGDQKSNRYADRARKDASPKTKDPDPSPPGKAVELFHRNAAVDTRPEDMHHTIGPGTNQAAPGSHNHDGGDSALLLEGYTILGNKASPATVLPSIILALTRLGMKDSTT